MHHTLINTLPHLAHSEEVQNSSPRHFPRNACSFSMLNGVTGGLSNRVDGHVAILDYPDDHYTALWAQTRKFSAASLCQGNNIRNTRGVLHLAALSRLHTKPELVIPTEHGLRNANEDLQKEAWRLEKDVRSYYNRGEKYRRQRAYPKAA